jgi:hypothetical protein
MHVRATGRRIALASAAALVAASLTGTPAQAAPVFSISDLDLESGLDDNEACAVNPGTVVSPPVNSAPVPENGAAVTATHGASGSVTNGAGDTQSGSSSITVTAATASTGADLKSMELTAQGSLTITNTVADSVCEIDLRSAADLQFAFTVVRPGFLTLDHTVRGHGFYTELYLDSDAPDNPYHDIYGQGLELDASTVVFLPAGTYSGYLEAELERSSETAVSVSGRATMKATFAPIGSQTEAAAGKAKKYVTLPATARDCAADTVTGSITDSRKRAKIVKLVKVFVNGDLEKKVKNPGRGDAVAVTGVADGVAADVRAVVKLEKKANGKKRNPVEVTASYEACAPSA